VSRVLKSPVSMIRAVSDNRVTTFFPADCRVCGGPLAGAGLSPLRDACRSSDLREQTGAWCVGRGEALDLDRLRFTLSLREGTLWVDRARSFPSESERTAAWALARNDMQEYFAEPERKSMGADRRSCLERWLQVGTENQGQALDGVEPAKGKG
jgi:hypothetical protein